MAGEGIAGGAGGASGQGSGAGGGEGRGDGAAAALGLRLVQPAARVARPPSRRAGLAADERRALIEALRAPLAGCTFGGLLALALPGAAVGERALAAACGAALLAGVLALLASGWSGGALGFAGRASLGAVVAAPVTVKALHAGGLHGLPAPSPTRELAVAVALLPLAAALGRMCEAAARRVRRRVLLIDGADAAMARAAVGAERLVLLGPLARGDAATLAAFGDAGIDDAVVGQRLADAELVALSCALRDASVRIHAVEPGRDVAERRDPRRDRDPGSPRRAPFTRVVSYRRSALSPSAALAKRAFDAVAAALLIVLLAPLLLAIAVAIRLGSPGPVLFRQRRVGLRGSFAVLKFRTMEVGAHLRHEELIAQHGNMFKLRRDPRVTRVGRWLRRLSLDELPQLVHVLAGEMSLVGPRPPMVEEVARYTPAQLRRLGARPGLTGLWQVSGRGDLTLDDCVALDARYIEGWSPRLELSILARTAGAVLGGRGAY